VVDDVDTIDTGIADLILPFPFFDAAVVVEEDDDDDDFNSSSICFSGLVFRLAGTGANALASAAKRSNPSDAIYSFRSPPLLLDLEAELLFTLDITFNPEDADGELDGAKDVDEDDDEDFEIYRVEEAAIVGFRGGLNKSGVYYRFEKYTIKKVRG
jgi:hypothetical protein